MQEAGAAPSSTHGQPESAARRQDREDAPARPPLREGGDDDDRPETPPLTQSGTDPEELVLAGAPALVRPAPGRDPDAALVLLWHGFGTPASARALAESLPLRGLPMWVAYLDLPLFGRRAPAAGADRLARRQEEDYLLELVWPVVRDAVDELPGVVGALRSEFGGEFTEGIGLFGFSAGGTAVLRALAERPLPLSAALVLGAPKDEAAPIAAFERFAGIAYEWSDEARRTARQLDFLERADAVAAGDPPPALLLLHGEDDAVIPASESRALFGALRPRYREGDHGDRLGLEVLPGVGHGFSADVGRRVRRWFRAHLGGSRGGRSPGGGARSG